MTVKEVKEELRLDRAARRAGLSVLFVALAVVLFAQVSFCNAVGGF